MSVKVPVTALSLSMVIVSGLVLPLRSPDQPAKTEPSLGATLSVTDVVPQASCVDPEID